MDAERLEVLLGDWQTRLGLGHWTIKLVVDGAHIAEDDDDVAMRVYTHQLYDDAVLEVAPWMLGVGEPPDRIEAQLLDDALVERKLVHELLHCVTRDLVAIVRDDLDGSLHRDVMEQVNAHVRRLEEHAVDRLAKALVTTLGSDSRGRESAILVQTDRPLREEWLSQELDESVHVIPLHEEGHLLGALPTGLNVTHGEVVQDAWCWCAPKVTTESPDGGVYAKQLVTHRDARERAEET